MFKSQRGRLLLKVFGVYILITSIFTISYEFIPIIVNFSVFKEESFYSSFITGLYNGIIDFIIFTFIIWVYNNKLDEKDKIKQCHTEINNCRFWMSEEAMYRIWANIRRLTEMNVESFDLSNCMLDKIKIKEYKFIDSKFMAASIDNANLKNCNFNKSDLQGVSFHETNLQNAIFNLCNCKYWKIIRAKCQSSYFENCDFTKSDFESSDFSNAIFRNCDFKKVNLKDTCLYRATIKDAKNLTVEQLLQCRTIEYISLDESFYCDDMIKIKSKKYPPSQKAKG